MPETQYVYINDTVTFECATNLTGHALIFTVGGVIQLSTAVTTLPNGGRKISLSQVATDQLNGTDVVCQDNNGNAAETVYIYVQG